MNFCRSHLIGIDFSLCGKNKRAGRSDSSLIERNAKVAGRRKVACHTEAIALQNHDGRHVAVSKIKRLYNTAVSFHRLDSFRKTCAGSIQNTYYGNVHFYCVLDGLGNLLCALFADTSRQNFGVVCKDTYLNVVDSSKSADNAFAGSFTEQGFTLHQCKRFDERTIVGYRPYQLVSGKYRS